jgi:hypothetical protein
VSDNRKKTSGLSGALLLGQGAAAHLSRRLDSRQWWLIVTCEACGISFASHLERVYYAGEANRDLELVVLPAIAEGFGLVCLYLAKKSRLPAERLHRELSRHVGTEISVEDMRTRDVLFPHPDTRVAAALAEFMVGFLSPPVRPEDN